MNGIYAVVIADLRVRRDEIDVAIKTLEAMQREPTDQANKASARRDNVIAIATREIVVGDLLGLSISEAALKLLRLMGEGMSVREIAQTLKDHGFMIFSKDPVATVGVILSRRKRKVGDIIRVGSKKWGLKEWFIDCDINQKDLKIDDVPVQTALNSGK